MLLALAWRGRYLEFDSRDRAAIYMALNDASNAEDGFAEDTAEDPIMRRFARRASLSLAALASKVLGVKKGLADKP